MSLLKENIPKNESYHQYVLGLLTIYWMESVSQHPLRRVGGQFVDPNSFPLVSSHLVKANRLLVFSGQRWRHPSWSKAATTNHLSSSSQLTELRQRGNSNIRKQSICLLTSLFYGSKVSLWNSRVTNSCPVNRFAYMCCKSLKLLHSGSWPCAYSLVNASLAMSLWVQLYRV